MKRQKQNLNDFFLVKSFLRFLKDNDIPLCQEPYIRTFERDCVLIEDLTNIYLLNLAICNPQFNYKRKQILMIKRDWMKILVRYEKTFKLERQKIFIRPKSNLQSGRFYAFNEEEEKKIIKTLNYLIYRLDKEESKNLG